MTEFTNTVPNTETVTLTIDGESVTVPKGTNVIEAARRLGIDVSAFCYHPGLSIAACCRQCLVTIENSPKLQPSCQAIVGDGMVVHTKDEQSTLARKQMLEFTLVNHPIDCPICDKAGECTLQKLYFDNNGADSRVDVPKVNKPKVVDLGPHIVLDAERCILCTRCIRVCDEVAGQHQLEMHQRGDREQLGTAPGEQLDNPYSLNTVDVCPVGALTSKDFRFTMRAWELMMTPSICNGCATGCNIEIHHRNQRVWRLQPRANEQVNNYWMCDEGRFTYHDLRKNRLVTPVVDGMPASWQEALSQVATTLGALVAEDSSAVGVVFSPKHTNEANYVLYKMARKVWELPRCYVGGDAPIPDRADDILRDADVNANSKGVAAIVGKENCGDLVALERDIRDGTLRVLLVLGHSIPWTDKALAEKLDKLVVIADREVGIAKEADILLPCAAWAEVDGTVTNRNGNVQRMRAAYEPSGQAIPAWKVLTKIAHTCDVAVNFTNPKAVFDEMVGQVPAFAGAKWGRATRPLQLRWAGSRG